MVASWLLEFVETLRGGEVRGSSPAASNILYIELLSQPMSDTWCPWIGPRVLLLLATQGHVSTSNLPTIDQSASAMSPCTVCMALPRQTVRTIRPCHITVQTGIVSIKLFPCLAWQTDHDIFSIRTLFEKVNIPLELGRRDRRNGTIFITF
jgi:hypothetical protein